jgi:hypothetical protein
MFPRNDQKMDRCSRTDVFKNNKVVILIDKISLPLALDNLTKLALFIH